MFIKINGVDGETYHVNRNHVVSVFDLKGGTNKDTFDAKCYLEMSCGRILLSSDSAEEVVRALSSV